MEKEQIFFVEDNPVTLMLYSEGIETFGEKYGHKMLAQASSLGEVKSIMEGGLRPTVAIVDNSIPGVEAAKIIKKASPKTVVVSFSADENLNWGDQNWSKKKMDPKQLTEALTSLQH
jgi:CheY-like chemotaxis protein